MSIGAFTGQFDLPLFLVDLFVLFFFCLVYYLRQEDKREGYPLVSDRTTRTGGRVPVIGFPAMPAPKVFHLPHGRADVYAPRSEEAPAIEALGVGNFTGMPIDPIGDPLLSRTGPASWTDRIDEPDLSYDGQPIFMPLRDAPEYRVMQGDADPRGFVVLGLDKQVAGRVVDIWIDRSEHHAKFLEVELDAAIASTAPDARASSTTGLAAGEIEEIIVIDEIIATPAGLVEVIEVDVITHPAEGMPERETDPALANAAPAHPGRVMLPMDFASVNGRKRTVRTAAITAAQFARVPRRKADVVLTAREENRIRGYYGGGTLWAVPSRAEPLL